MCRRPCTARRPAGSGVGADDRCDRLGDASRRVVVVAPVPVVSLRGSGASALLPVGLSPTSRTTRRCCRGTVVSVVSVGARGRGRRGCRIAGSRSAQPDGGLGRRSSSSSRSTVQCGRRVGCGSAWCRRVIVVVVVCGVVVGGSSWSGTRRAISGDDNALGLAPLESGVVVGVDVLGDGSSSNSSGPRSDAARAASPTTARSRRCARSSSGRRC